MEQKNLVGIVLVCLLIGFGGGYLVKAQDRDGNDFKDRVGDRRGSHMMENGDMMENMMNDGDEAKNTSKSNGTDTMGSMMGHMNASLEGKTGDEFDKEFITQMIVHHQGAVDMANLGLTQSKHQEIKDLSKEIIAAQNKEIASMQAWLANWYSQ
jgi:uncharacterized protein (DUF305 family)